MNPLYEHEKLVKISGDHSQAPYHEPIEFLMSW